jgi:hypothetical protein
VEWKEDKVVPMTNAEKIERLESFKADVLTHEKERITADLRQALRSKINQEKTWARRQAIEASCFHTFTISPPPAFGGLIMRDLDPFEMLFERPYLQSMVPRVIDMIDQTIGVLKAGPEDVAAESEVPIVEENITPHYAFVAMPMDESSPKLVDVLDAIKEGCRRCGIQAERVDEPESNERITDRIVESIRKAEYVIVDLTNQRPNVYWEAGYAHGIRKTPVYVARYGTKIEFDLKDYPIIFFKSLKELKDLLEKRLRGLAERKGTQRWPAQRPG